MNNHSAGNFANRHQQANNSRSWSQLNYCRETNVFFNRKQHVEPPLKLREQQQQQASKTTEMQPPAPQQLRLKTKVIRQQDDSDQSQSQNQTQHTQKRTLSESSSTSDSEKKLDLVGAREKLIAQVNKHPFWSNKAAKKMQLTSIEERSIYIYELVSYCERREIEWKYEPYRGGLSGSGSAYASSALTASNVLSISSTGRPGSSSGGSGGVDLNNNSSSNTGRRLSASLQLSPLSRTPVAFSSSKAGENQTRKPPLQTRQLPGPEEVWAVEVPSRSRPEAFAGYVWTSEFPQSSFVKRCHCCQGRGRFKCDSCYGVGYEVCISCSGKGTRRSHQHSSSLSSSMMGSGSQTKSSYMDHHGRNSSTNGWYDNDCSSSANADSKRFYGEPGGITGGSGSTAHPLSSGSSSSGWATESCHFCHGAGQKRCWICSGRAHVQCQLCAGSGQLRCYLRLIVTWLNHKDEFTLNDEDNVIPKERLRLSSRLIILDETSDKLEAGLDRARLDGVLVRNQQAEVGGTQPPTRDSTLLDLGSRKLLERHRAQFEQQERLVKQRQRVTKVDCFIVNYEWKRRKGHFVIYGDERKVYIAKYPFKSICNIT